MEKILLVHGAGATELSWESVSRHFPNCVKPTYSILDNFKKIMSDVESSLNDQDTYVVVGHSFGGIVAYHLAQKYPNIRKGISIATPWGGSTMAQLGSYVWLDNQFFKNVGRYENHIKITRTKAVPVPWLNIITVRGIFGNSNDGVVTVASQRELYHENVYYYEVPYSHNEVLMAPYLVDLIKSFLD